MCETKWIDEFLKKAVAKQLNFEPMSKTLGPAVYHELFIHSIREPVGLASIERDAEGEDGVVRAAGSSHHIFFWIETSSEFRWFHYCAGGLKTHDIKGEQLIIQPFIGDTYALDMRTGEITPIDIA